MKALLGMMLLASAVAFSLGSTEAPAAPMLAQPAPAQLAESSEPAEGVCPYYFVCDDPYGAYQTLRQCQNNCSAPCDLVYTCNP